MEVLSGDSVFSGRSGSEIDSTAKHPEAFFCTE
jgi:hypothetical protein